MTALVEMAGIGKSYGPTVALRGVSFRLDPGTVHALVGENGAGKSTLMKILSGVVAPDEGTLHLQGERVVLPHPRAALDRGIATVFQELSLLPNLTVAENIFLGHEPRNRWGMVDRRAMEERSAELLEALELAVSPRTLVRQLSLAERQFVEIARGLGAHAKVLILDEPSAALNAADVEKLFRQVRRLREAGTGIIYISHRLEEIFALADTVTVFKDGAEVGTYGTAGLGPDQLIALMVGRDLVDLFPARGTAAGEVALAVEELRLSEAAPAVSLEVGRGEIVGLAGLEGQGQREILRSLVGLVPCRSGRVRVGGTVLELPLGAREGIRAGYARGMGMIPEDRKEEGLLLDLSVAANLRLTSETLRGALAPRRRARGEVARQVGQLAIKAASPDAPVASLSGGNQQKVLLGRVLGPRLEVLLVEEPTRGVDVGAKVEIYQQLRDFAAAGGAVLLLSRETLELIGLCDRLLVVHGGRVVGEMPGAEATDHAILEAALTAEPQDGGEAA
jgi:ribose transport system ATP-binding protein